MSPLLLLTTLAVGQVPEVVYPQPFPPAVVAPVPPAVAVPVPVLVAKPRPMTVEEFVRVFRPIPGKHQVTLIHPKSGRPVDVSFDLPCAPPGTEVVVRWSRHEIRFGYGERAVVIRFRIFHGVSVYTT